MNIEGFCPHSILGFEALKPNEVVSRQNGKSWGTVGFKLWISRRVPQPALQVVLPPFGHDSFRLLFPFRSSQLLLAQGENDGTRHYKTEPGPADVTQFLKSLQCSITPHPQPTFFVAWARFVSFIVCWSTRNILIVPETWCPRETSRRSALPVSFGSSGHVVLGSLHNHNGWIPGAAPPELHRTVNSQNWPRRLPFMPDVAIKAEVEYNSL